MRSFLHLIGALAILALATLYCFAGKGAPLKQVKDDKYKPGEVWSYKTRSGETSSTLTILRIERTPEKRRIIHIRVDDIQLTNCTGGPAPNKFEHMPFSKEAIDISVVKILRTGPVPDFRDGYFQWRTAWDAGKAGFYTISVAQALDASQAIFDHGIGCSK